MLKGRAGLIKTTARRILPNVRKMDMTRTHVKEGEDRINKQQLNRKKKIFYAIFDIV